jgi:hypothetical protein
MATLKMSDAGARSKDRAGPIAPQPRRASETDAAQQQSASRVINVPTATHAQLVALQRTAGNAATASLVSQTPVQRVKDPKKPDLTPAEKTQKADHLRIAAREVDSHWNLEIQKAITATEQGIERVSGGLDAANSKFTTVQNAQAASDALRMQIVMGLISVGFAAGFERLFQAAIGQRLMNRLDRKLSAEEKRYFVLGNTPGQQKAEAVKEAIENPANTSISAGTNIGGAAQAQQNQAEGEAPDDVLDPEQARRDVLQEVG